MKPRDREAENWKKPGFLMCLLLEEMEVFTYNSIRVLQRNRTDRIDRYICKYSYGYRYRYIDIDMDSGIGIDVDIDIDMKRFIIGMASIVYGG